MSYIREHVSIIAVGVISAFAYLYLALTTQNYEQPTLSAFLFVMLLCGLLSFALCGYYQKGGRQIPISLLLGFAVLFRLIALWGLPIFEDDFYRYLWDGKLLVETGQPYGVAPAAFFGSDGLTEKFEDILSQINHPNIATVYGPFCQWVFAVGYLIAPGEIWPLQLIFGLADMAIVLMLLRMAKPNWVMLYAWSPLMIKEFAFTAHPDVLGVALLLGGFLLMKSNRWVFAAVLLALAAATKVFALILIPFLLGFRIRAWFVFGVTALLVALPFGVLQAWKPEGLDAMATSWLFNAPIYLLLLQWFSFSTVKSVLLGTFVVFWALYLAREMYWERMTDSARKPFRPDVLFAVFFLCAPVLNAWYYVWLLPFAVIYPSMTAWVGSVALCLAYVSGINMLNSELGLYEQPMMVLVIQFAVIAIAFIWDVWRCNKRQA